MYVCQICKKKPKSHSFEILKEDNDNIIYYSRPSEALFPHDHDGIIEHYKGVFKSKGSKNWTWIIDGKDFKTYHINVKITMSLSNLLSNYEDTMQKIIIINSSKTLQSAVAMAWAFISKNMKEKIRIDNNYKFNANYCSSISV